MTINYTTLIGDKSTAGSIKNWVNYSLVPAETVLTMAQAYIYERMRHWLMMVETPVSIAADASILALPDRFLDPIELRLDGDGEPLTYVHENLLGRDRDEDSALTSGALTKWALMNGQIMFDVETDTARVGKLWFYQTPAPLSGSVETNFLTERFPVLLYDACNAFANGHRKLFGERDKGLMMVAAAIRDANIASDMARRGQTQR